MFQTTRSCLWEQFSLTEIRRPKWCASRLVRVEHTDLLVATRFSRTISRVDLSKMCFSFDTLGQLFAHCTAINSLAINFKYLQMRGAKFLVEQCIHRWPVNSLRKLYLKNVCDMKIRRLHASSSSSNNHSPLSSSFSPSSSSSSFSSFSSYDLIECEVIKLIRMLFRNNAQSLRVLGLKCVDPNVISSCIHDLSKLEILLLNNVNDTDGVLQELSLLCRNLKCLELNKCREFKGDGLQVCVYLLLLFLFQNIFKLPRNFFLICKIGEF